MSESIVTNTRNVVVNDVYTFSPTLINQATFSFLNSGSNQLQGKTIDPSALGINMPQYVPGGAVDVNVGGEFDLGSVPALTVPQSAIVVRDGFSYVYRLSQDSHVGQLKVQTGRFEAGRVEIVTGLPADTRVVTSGAGFLNDGDLVRVVVDGTPSSALPASAAPK